MASPGVPPPLMAINITEEDQQRFNALWQLHIRLLSQGKVVYYIPLGMALQMDPAGMLGVAAHNLSMALSTDIYVHYDSQRRIYRLGQIFDEHDRNSVSQSTCYGHVQFTPAQAPTQAPNAAVQSVVLMNSPSMPAQKISKPANSWILYRKSKHHLVLSQNPRLHTSYISQIIGQMWQAEPDHVKAFWRQRAHEVKAEHLLKHPNYRPQPRKSSSIKRRKTSRKTASLDVNSAYLKKRPASSSAVALPRTHGGNARAEFSPEAFNRTQLTVNDAAADSYPSIAEENVEYLWSGVNHALNAQGDEYGSNTAWLDDGSA